MPHGDQTQVLAFKCCPTLLSLTITHGGQFARNAAWGSQIVITDYLFPVRLPSLTYTNLCSNMKGIVRHGVSLQHQKSNRRLPKWNQ
jgi:hypothetical protein